MKVLLYDTTNAFLTPGGKTTHAIKLQQEISKLGVDIQFAEWWNLEQKDFDLIHFLVEEPTVAKLAKLKGRKTFSSMIFDYVTNLPTLQKCKAKLSIRAQMALFPENVARWNALKYMDR